jgi:nucleotide-binding universal stress UspA family protein
VVQSTSLEVPDGPPKGVKPPSQEDKGGHHAGMAVRIIDTILLATDLSEASQEATDHAIGLASQLTARLLIVNVLERRRLSGSGSHERIDQARAEREARLVDLVLAANGLGVTAEFLVWEGDPGDAIVAAAEAECADLVVVGTRGRSGAGRMLLGSVSDHLIRNISGPVLVVRSGEASTQ